MTVLSVTKNTEDLTMTLVADLAADTDRAWQLWADPRQLERWWGPPTYPATFEQYEFASGGRAAYVMTGPDGDRSRGWWEFIAVEQPSRIELRDGFADDNGEPSDLAEPMTMNVALDAIESGTRMTILTRFADVASLEQMIAMGMNEGMREAVGQIDAILAE